MYRTTPNLLRLAVPLLVAIAGAGLFAGHLHSSSTPAGAATATRIAYGANVQLEYPASWRQTSADLAPAIAGLPIADALLLAPGGRGARAGLLSGQIPDGESSPLPDAFLALLHDAPHTEVVDLLDAQAYRYSRLNLRGYDRILQLYVIPIPGGRDAALACYASKPLAGYLKQCQQIVAGLTLVGGSPSDLTPEAGYAGRLDRVIGKLDSKRLTLRAGIRRAPSRSAVSQIASALVSSFAATASSLSLLEPPPPAGATQAALARSILAARAAYEALAAAVLTGSSGGYATAQMRVERSEGDVDAALESFALLGYSQE